MTSKREEVHPDDLMGAREIETALGVSRQRVQQLVKHPDFPAPVARLAMGSLWNRPDFEAWAQRHGRTLH